jgi:hypothetical protein
MFASGGITTTTINRGPRIEDPMILYRACEGLEARILLFPLVITTNTNSEEATEMPGGF